MILYNAISVGLTRPTRREEFHSPLCALTPTFGVGLVVNLGEFSQQRRHPTLEAVINFSALQRFPIERVCLMNSSYHISMKYFSDFYIRHRRGI
jgi:hypothetical protein